MNEEGVNQTFVYDGGTTVGYQYDSGRLPTVAVVDPIGHRTNITYDAAADYVDQPTIIEKPKTGKG